MRWKKIKGYYTLAKDIEEELNSTFEEVKPEEQNTGVNYLELAQRIQAEFENYKRRNKDIEKNSYRNGIVNAVRSMLPVVDSFNQAVEGIQDENVLKGLNIIRNQLMKKAAVDITTAFILFCLFLIIESEKLIDMSKKCSFKCSIQKP